MPYPQTASFETVAAASNPSFITAIQTSVNNILGLAGQSVQNQYIAAAQGYSQQGAQAQEQSYGAATEIAQQNAALESAAAQVQEYQQQIQAGQQIGTMIATRAANGFKNAGTPLMMLRSSLMQASLARQLTSTQGQITAGGFLEQAAASQAEAAAAQAAANAAGVLGQAATAASAIDAANAAQESSLLAEQLKTMFPNTPTQTNGQSETLVGTFGEPQQTSSNTNAVFPNISSVIQTALNGIPQSAPNSSVYQPAPTVYGGVPVSNTGEVAQQLQGVATNLSGVQNQVNNIFSNAQLPLISQNGWPIG